MADARQLLQKTEVSARDLVHTCGMMTAAILALNGSKNSNTPTSVVMPSWSDGDSFCHLPDRNKHSI